MQVIPAISFTGYPDGRKTKFVAGQPVEVSADYAEILRRKGLTNEPEAKSKRKSRLLAKAK